MVDLISVHIGKTAGTAFLSVLSDVYGSNNVLELYGESEKKLAALDERRSNQIKVIHGHFSTRLCQGRFPDAKWIVWLRHPIFRLISQYFYTQTIKQGQIKDDMSILEFAELPEVQNRLSVYINEMNLSEFYFVGIQEFFLEDIMELKEALNWSDFPVEVKNSNRYSGYQESLQKILGDRQLVNRLAELNDRDLELYQTALNLRAKRRHESKWLQQTLADWNRTQFITQQLQEKLQKKELELKESNFKNTPINQEREEKNIKIIKFPLVETQDCLLGFGIFKLKSEPNNHYDKITIQGWVLGKDFSALTVNLIAKDKVLAKTQVEKFRPGIGKRFPSIPKAKFSGFDITIEREKISNNPEIIIEATLENREIIALGRICYSNSQTLDLHTIGN